MFYLSIHRHNAYTQPFFNSILQPSHLILFPIHSLFLYQYNPHASPAPSLRLTASLSCICSDCKSCTPSVVLVRWRKVRSLKTGRPPVKGRAAHIAHELHRTSCVFACSHLHPFLLSSLPSLLLPPSQPPSERSTLYCWPGWVCG